MKCKAVTETAANSWSRDRYTVTASLFVTRSDDPNRKQLEQLL